MKWNLDITHSEITFKVRHMMIAHVTGSFQRFAAEIESSDAEFHHPKINLQLDVASISTRDAQRDAHLLTADFFDAEQFPQITFVATAFSNEKLTGALTMHGITKTIELQVEDGGTGQDPWGNQRRGFTIHGSVLRSDFGLTWNAALETGGFLIGDEIKINAEIQLIQAQ